MYLNAFILFEYFTKLKANNLITIEYTKSQAANIFLHTSSFAHSYHRLPLVENLLNYLSNIST